MNKIAIISRLAFIMLVLFVVADFLILSILLVNRKMTDSIARADAESTFRVTEYFVTGTSFSGTTYTQTLNQDLATNYFIIVEGSDGNGSGGNSRGPDENYISLTADPNGTGDLAASGATDELDFIRGNSVNSWLGVIKVVECLTDCENSGFQLLDVQRVAHTGTGTSGTDTSGTSWSDINQVSLIGGYHGSGCDTAEAAFGFHKVCHARIFPSGSNTINWTRDNGLVTLSTATSTVHVVEWGDEWTVQRVNVTGSSGGDGANIAGEYDSSTITSVVRDNTWVWGTGHAANDGIGEASEGTLITLGDGATQNANETQVSIGMEYAISKDFEVYAFTHPDLAVDYRFKADGNSGDLLVDVTVDTNTETTNRMALVTNGQNGQGTAYPRPNLASGYLNNTTVRISRRRSGQNFPAWVQGMDFSGIESPGFIQGGYRVFANADSANVGAALAAQDTPATLSNTGDNFRIRMLMRITDAQLLQNTENFVLQFAGKGGGTCAAPTGTPSTYTDITGDDTRIGLFNNPTPADGDALTDNVNDPNDGATVNNQSYEEIKDFTNNQSTIPIGEDGLFDFSLYDNGAGVNSTYCFRMVQSDGTPFSSYQHYPEVTTADNMVHVGTFAKSTAVGPASQSVSGLGFQPEVIFFWWTRQTTTGFSADMRSGFGFTSGPADERAVGYAEDDNLGTSNAGRRKSEQRSIIMLSDGTPTLAAEAELTSFDTDGFTLNWVTNEARADIIHYMALDGVDIDNTDVGTFTLSASTGNQVISGVGFEPSFVFFLWSFTGASEANLGNALLSLGMATNASEQGTITVASQDNQADNTIKQSRQFTNSVITNEDLAGLEASASFVSMDSDGFTIDVTDATGVSLPVFYLAVRGGRYDVGNFTQPAVTGNQSTTGIGFEPEGLMLFSRNQVSSGTRSEPAALSVGGTASPSYQLSTWVELDEVDPSDVNMYTSRTDLITLANSPNTVNAQADIESFDSDGFTLDWTTVDATARELLYFTVNPDDPVLAVDIVDSGGVSVVSPTVTFDPLTLDFAFQTSTGTLGESAERIRVTNETGNPQWSLTMAATSGATSFWDGVSDDFDFNDPTASAGDGGDTDLLGGQLTINPSVGTISPQSGCASTGITLGSSAAYSEGVLDSITIATSDGTADADCFFDLTDIDLSQSVPAEQISDSYDIDMTLTIVAI